MYTVTNFRKWEGSGTFGFFDINIDDVFVVRGCALKRKRDGGYFWTGPSKPRQKKVQAVVDGQTVTAYVAVLDDKNYPVYDAAFDLFTQKNASGDFKPTKAAFDVKDAVLAQAVAAYQGSATATAGIGVRQAPAEVAQAVEGATGVADDDLPF